MNKTSLTHVIHKFDNITNFYLLLIYSQPVIKGSITMAHVLEVAKTV